MFNAIYSAIYHYYLFYLFGLDPNLREFRDFKELYVSFNQKYGDNPVGAAREINVWQTINKFDYPKKTGAVQLLFPGLN